MKPTPAPGRAGRRVLPSHRAPRTALRVALLVSALLPVPARTDAQSIIGRVVEQGRSRAIGQVFVAIAGTRIYTLTDSTGTFTFEDVPAGEHVLQVRHIAFGARADTLVVPREGTVHVMVSLSREVIGLDPLYVSVLSPAARQRRAAASGQHVILDRAQIMAAVGRGARNVGEILRRNAGNAVSVRPMGGGLNAQGLCIESPRARNPRTGLGPDMPRSRSRPDSALIAGSCAMVALVVDNTLVAEPMTPMYLATLPAEEIRSVEFLPPADALLRYGAVGQRGVLVVHTGAIADPLAAADSSTDVSHLGPGRGAYLAGGVAAGFLGTLGYLYVTGLTDACSREACVRDFFTSYPIPVLVGITAGLLAGEVTYRVAQDGS